MKTACVQCPWRLANQGKKPDPLKFYTTGNLRRLWNGLRKGGPQSCHLTDPTHPDHLRAGAPEGAKAQECPGSLIVIQREIRRCANAEGAVEPAGIDRYRAARPKLGLTKSGLRYWLLNRIQFAHVTMLGGKPMPEVDVSDAEVGLPEAWREG